MQTIFTTPKTGNFSITSNNLADSGMDPVAKAILLYLLAKPSDWQLNTNHMKKLLKLTYYKVKKGLKELKQLGHLTLERLHTGRCIWRVYESPILTPTPATPPSVDYRPVDDEPVLIKLTNTNTKNNYTPPQPTPPPISSPVVVMVDIGPTPLPVPVIPNTPAVIEVDALEYPKQLNEPQKKAAKAVIHKVQKQEIKQEVLFALAYALSAGSVHNPIGYLTTLVQRANNGTFTPVNPPKKPLTAGERVKKEREEQAKAAKQKVDNLAHFRNLFRQFGNSVLGCIPEEYRVQLV